MSTPLPLAAIRILKPLPCQRPLSSDNVIVMSVTGDHQAPLADDPSDPITLCNEFNKIKSIEDLSNQLEMAGFTDVVVVPVSLETVAQVADALENEMKEKQEQDQDLVVFQLCDGTELDGYTGVSIIHELEKRKIAYTGSDSGTSKPILKRELQKAHVPTSSFQEFSIVPQPTDLENIIREIGFPMIVKPSISYASINISKTSVVHTPEQLLEQITLSLNASMTGGKLGNHLEDEELKQQLQENHQDQNVLNIAMMTKEQKMEIDIETPTVFVEKFLAGREFTALVIGDKDWGVRVYPVAERAFDPKLGKFERLLSFDQYWDGYDLEGNMGDTSNEEFCKYEIANKDWQEHLQQVARDAYLALDGSGYGRVDIRTIEMDGCEPVVLEVNANCGLSFEKDSSSLANILLMSKVDPPGFVRDLIDHALQRKKRLHEAGPTYIHKMAHHANPATAYNTSARDTQDTVLILVQG
ncbi:hypothetical protein BG011_003963 [Mortierella polycephala]|uniref:ATP-grasp domain-containing protein n=1 Tax=Mortierella polycephala TaxID=41804 RepID=A0A9P6U3B3_9FUNG|nr:hypothetical protein BG011_003963 [Mortierella polycephala]